MHIPPILKPELVNPFCMQLNSILNMLPESAWSSQRPTESSFASGCPGASLNLDLNGLQPELVHTCRTQLNCDISVASVSILRLPILILNMLDFSREHLKRGTRDDLSSDQRLGYRSLIEHEY